MCPIAYKNLIIIVKKNVLSISIFFQVDFEIFSKNKNVIRNISPLKTLISYILINFNSLMSYLKELNFC